MRILAKVIFVLALVGASSIGVAAAPAALAVISYRPDGKLMLVQASVNGAPPAWFCIDSGATNSVIDDRLAAELKLKTVSTGSVTGTGQGQVPVRNLQPVTLKLGAIEVKVATPYGIDLSGVPIAKDTRGLLGFDAFDQYVVRIDPTTRTVSFYDRQAFDGTSAGAAIPMTVERRRMYIDARLDVRPGLSVTHRLRVDLGSEESVNDPIVAQSREVRTTRLGNGLGEDFAGVSGVFDAVQIGPFEIRHVWGPGGPGPAVGMEIFRRFVSTFDAGRGVVYLTPTAALSEPVPAPEG